MSRSRKGSKGVGFDYWGRRAMSAACGFGKIVKTMTKRIERRVNKQRERLGEFSKRIWDK